MTLRDAHRLSAAVVFVFIAVHLLNHLAALWGVAVHMAWMDRLRVVYRHPLAETLLTLAVLWQAASGLTLLWRGRGTRHGGVARWQAVSGAYLAFFLLVHVGAVWVGRLVLGLDTNFHFAAAGLHAPPFGWFFGPYYFLAVLALFTHVGCALHWWLRPAWPQAARAVVVLSVAKGAVVAALITLALAGAFEAFEVPAEYLATYRWR